VDGDFVGTRVSASNTFMKTCPSKKKMYLSELLAEEALLEVRSTYHYGKGSAPIAVYRCEDCGCYHLTSKGIINAKLEKHIKEGKVSLQKEANYWLDKFKRK
jgi:ABC-type ATPase with predicted acetyltransferase domain